MAYLIVWVVKVVIQLGHGFRYRAERLNDVAEDDGFPLQAFILVETLRVYELHLLQDGRFPRLSSAYKLHMISTRVGLGGTARCVARPSMGCQRLSRLCANH